MTFITRAARRYNAASPAGARRLWLRRNSTVWAHLDPRPADPTFPCDACGSPLPTVTDKHRIGSVWIEGQEHAKFCDGTETP